MAEPLLRFLLIAGGRLPLHTAADVDDGGGLLTASDGTPPLVDGVWTTNGGEVHEVRTSWTSRWRRPLLVGYSLVSPKGP